MATKFYPGVETIAENAEGEFLNLGTIYTKTFSKFRQYGFYKSHEIRYNINTENNMED